MSSYLLLRNNKESGPFTLDEIKGMSLKAYDLIWVSGKSAAWRYPGEISELKSLVPETPDHEVDYRRKKTNNEVEETGTSISGISENLDEYRGTKNGQRYVNSQSVYINLPSEKKSEIELSEISLSDTGLVNSKSQDSGDNLSELYRQSPSGIARFSGKILWVSTIILLFGAGIMTGFFISDRRNFFTPDDNHTQVNSVARQVNYKNKLENLSPNNTGDPMVAPLEKDLFKGDSVKKTIVNSRSSGVSTNKKNVKINEPDKDSLDADRALLSANRFRDSLKQDVQAKTEALYQKISANPEKYIDVVTGKYSTGLFGGISSFPVTVSNNSPVKIALVQVALDYVLNSDKIYRTENLSFNDLEPGETLTIKAPKSNRGTKIITHLHVVNVHKPDPGLSN